ncbi:MAG: hypothetical protein GXO78_12675 [Calditrichaeota bacterium]|nr:hypothetical protein [Calditrichota bacterium]
MNRGEGWPSPLDLQPLVGHLYVGLADGFLLNDLIGAFRKQVAAAQVRQAVGFDRKLSLFLREKCVNFSV